MRYYLLVSSNGGKTVQATWVSSKSRTIDEWRKVFGEDVGITIVTGMLRYFLVDEERYNRWWRDYLDRD